MRRSRRRWRAATKERKQPLYNVSPYTFAKLIGDPNGLAKNLTAYIKGFSPKVREIFDKFEFEKEIEKLDDANRLFEVIKIFAALDLHPDTVPNLAMGYVFENLKGIATAPVIRPARTATTARRISGRRCWRGTACSTSSRATSTWRSRSGRSAPTRAFARCARRR